MAAAPITCIIIDDEPLALRLMKDYISLLPSLQLVAAFDDAITAREFLQTHPVDLLFTDINMPHISGLDLMRSLKERPMLIFTTAYRNFAVEGFELNAVDYLVKPISKERFNKAVQKAREFFDYKRYNPSVVQEYLFVYSEYRLLKIPLVDIEYIESLEDYIKIHLSIGKPIMTLMTLKGALEKLPGHRFRRIHRSYIVGVSKIKSVLNKKITLISGTELPVSDSFYEVIKEWKQGI